MIFAHKAALVQLCPLLVIYYATVIILVIINDRCEITKFLNINVKVLLNRNPNYLQI